MKSSDVMTLDLVLFSLFTSVVWNHTLLLFELLLFCCRVFSVMKTAQYISGTCRRRACNICTHCPRRTYLARRLCRRLKWPVTSIPTMSGRRSDEYKLLIVIVECVVYN